MQAPRLVLASGSPRRRDLLTSAGFVFVVDVADIEEIIAGGETPIAATSRLAIEKGEAVAARRLAAAQSRSSRELVLAADTTVVLGTRILGKPASRDEAVEMLLALAGRSHAVLTAWALIPLGDLPQAAESGIVRSDVRMREISRAEAEAYAAGGEPMDKAGAYAAQGEGRRFIGAIAGPLDNVIGLPMAPVVRALARSGVVPG